MNRQHWIALASGTLFGLGLAVSQMINPAKVLAFLDLAGHWDPSLALVMASALLFMAITWRLHERAAFTGSRTGSDRQPAMAEPARWLDKSLVTGAVLFGIGWGLVGYCPGPAIASLGLASPKVLVFVLSMLAGMLLYHAWDRRHAMRGLDDARV